MHSSGFCEKAALCVLDPLLSQACVIGRLHLQRRVNSSGQQCDYVLTPHAHDPMLCCAVLSQGAG